MFPTGEDGAPADGAGERLLRRSSSKTSGIRDEPGGGRCWRSPVLRRGAGSGFTRPILPPVDPKEPSGVGGGGSGERGERRDVAGSRLRLHSVSSCRLLPGAHDRERDWTCPLHGVRSSQYLTQTSPLVWKRM